MADIYIVHETAAMKPLRPVDGEAHRPPRRKAAERHGDTGQPHPAEDGAAGEDRPVESDEPPHSVDTYV
jgi:hypothetical protein